MVLTLNPVVNGVRHGRIVRSIALFGIAVWLAVALEVVAVWGAFQLLAAVSAPRVLTLALAALPLLWVVGHDLGVRLPVPYRKTQVPEWFRRHSAPEMTAAVYGFMLGVGFLTFYTSCLHLVTLIFGAVNGLGLALVFAGGLALGKLVPFVGMPATTEASRFESTFDQTFGRKFDSSALLASSTATVGLAAVALLWHVI